MRRDTVLRDHIRAKLFLPRLAPTGARQCGADISCCIGTDYGS